MIRTGDIQEDGSGILKWYKSVHGETLLARNSFVHHPTLPFLTPPNPGSIIDLFSH